MAARERRSELLSWAGMHVITRVCQGRSGVICTRPVLYAHKAVLYAHKLDFATRVAQHRKQNYFRVTVSSQSTRPQSAWFAPERPNPFGCCTLHIP